MSIVRVTPLDGKLPNLALMRLAAWHRAQGDTVHWERSIMRRFDEPMYDVIYGSAIFAETARKAAMFAQQFPGAIIGGSGGNKHLRVDATLPDEDKAGIPGPVPTQFTALDYSGYPKFTASIGYTMRGCRFKCRFCVVPWMEGAARSEGTITQIWRGLGHPKHVHLLDNDFFGNPIWRDRVGEIERGGFKVCINQGINVRLLDDEQAEAIVRVAPWDDQFNRRRLYTAWDNIGDEKVFFDGLDRLERAGWKADWTFVYMLVGYDPRETWERIFHRFNRMIARGVRPYPMVFAGLPGRPTVGDYRQLKRFQRWVITGAHKVSPFEQYSTARVRVADAPLFEKDAA